FFNTGTVSIETGVLRFARFHQTAGQTVLAGGVLDADFQVDPLSFEGGVLRGNGNVRGPISNTGGTVAPGPPNAAGTHSMAPPPWPTGCASPAPPLPPAPPT